MKLRDKHIRQILAKFGVENTQSKISEIKLIHPEKTTSLYYFRFQKSDWAILFDQDVEDDIQDIIKQTGWNKKDVKLFENPQLEASFGMPFQQKTCYLIHKKSSLMRLDQFLAKQHPEISRSKLQKMIKNQLVSVNQQIATSNKKLVNPETDQVELKSIEQKIKQLPEIDIIYQDDDIIAVNKPAGVLTHDIDPNHKVEQTLADFIQSRGGFTNPDYRSGIVHRLDRATSGIILLAKNDRAMEYLQQQFKQRQIEKTYIAISKGTPKLNQAKIDLPLKRSLKQPGKFMVDPMANQQSVFIK